MSFFRPFKVLRVAPVLSNFYLRRTRKGGRAKDTHADKTYANKPAHPHTARRETNGRRRTSEKTVTKKDPTFFSSPRIVHHPVCGAPAARRAQHSTFLARHGEWTRQQQSSVEDCSHRSVLLIVLIRVCEEGSQPSANPHEQTATQLLLLRVISDVRSWGRRWGQRQREQQQ